MQASTDKVLKEEKTSQCRQEKEWRKASNQVFQWNWKNGCPKSNPIFLIIPREKQVNEVKYTQEIMHRKNLKFAESLTVVQWSISNATTLF